VCNAPPPPACSRDLAQTYAALGTCGDAGCTYPVAASLDCALDDMVCEAGACVEAVDPGTPKPPAVGQVVLTEIMQNPQAVLDGVGEWVELLNLGPAPADLTGCLLESVNDSAWTFPALTVAAGGFVVLAASTDAALNGGVTSPAAFGSLQLSNSADTVTLTCAAPEVSAPSSGFFTFASASVRAGVGS
jgi:hypothetical protein